MTDKKVYSDEAIKAVIEEFGYSACKAYSDTGMDVFKRTAAMLQQLLNERNAVLKDLKILETEINIARTTTGLRIITDTKRSRKYDTEKPD